MSVYCPLTCYMYHNYDTIMKQQEILAEIDAVKQAISRVGHMHPGSLSVQKRAAGGEYYQLSYSFQGKGHTLYVRPDDVPETEAAIENYSRFRSLCRRWIELEVELARCRRAEASGKAHKL